MTNQNRYSHLTAKERVNLSFPAKFLYSTGLLVGDLLDFGCGFGKDVELLKAKDKSIIGYDKHYFPNYPESKFDTIICFYVLNVLMPEEQANVLMEVSQLLKPTTLRSRASSAIEKMMDSWSTSSSGSDGKLRMLLGNLKPTSLLVASPSRITLSIRKT